MPEHALASKLPVEDERRPARAVKQPSTSVPPFGAGPVIWRGRTHQVAWLAERAAAAATAQLDTVPGSLALKGRQLHALVTLRAAASGLSSVSDRSIVPDVYRATPVPVRFAAPYRHCATIGCHRLPLRSRHRDGVGTQQITQLAIR